MKNVTEEAIDLAFRLKDAILPSRDWDIFNIALNKSETFILSNYFKIPKSYGFTQSNTPLFMLQNGAFEAATHGWWYIGICPINSQFSRVFPREFPLDEKITEFARVKKYLTNDEMVEYYYNVINDEWGPKLHGQMAVLVSRKSLENFINKFSKGNLATIPVNREYWYENGIFQIKLTGGAMESVDYSRAKEDRAIFETFYELWKADGRGEYQVAEIVKMYRKINKRDLVSGRIGEKASNARNKIFKKPLLEKRIIWGFNKNTKLWDFKILPLNQ